MQRLANSCPISQPERIFFSVTHVNGHWRFGERHAIITGMTMTKDAISLPEHLEAELLRTREFETILRNARQASDFLKALAHETRLLLLCLLASRERSVTELENILSLRQPTVSQQLARLRLDGLVTTRREGKVIYYSIDDNDLKRVISVIFEIFCNHGTEPAPAAREPGRTTAASRVPRGVVRRRLRRRPRAKV